jgi:hypothetical protein
MRRVWRTDSSNSSKIFNNGANIADSSTKAIVLQIEEFQKLQESKYPLTQAKSKYLVMYLKDYIEIV